MMLLRKLCTPVICFCEKPLTVMEEMVLNFQRFHNLYISDQVISQIIQLYRLFAGSSPSVDLQSQLQ
jgi:hypothetical protein